MKNWIRGTLVSAMAVGVVAVASPLAHADIDGIAGTCHDIVSTTDVAYTGNVYVGPTPLTLDPSDANQQRLLAVVPTESAGSVRAEIRLGAASCATDTYQVTVIYPNGNAEATTVHGDGESDEVDITAPVTRHAGNCIEVQLTSIDENGVPQDNAPDATESPASVCNDGNGGGTGHWS